jgi:hypothetical protein
MKKPLSLALIAIGTCCYAGAKYISYQVELGESKVLAAQKQLHSASSFFSIIPIVPIGKAFTGSAQKQIDEAEKKIARYSQLAAELYHISIPVFFIGLVILTFSLRKKPR